MDSANDIAQAQATSLIAHLVSVSIVDVIVETQMMWSTGEEMQQFCDSQGSVSLGIASTSGLSSLSGSRGRRALEWSEESETEQERGQMERWMSTRIL
ncbi:hypothetical protein MUG91_G123n19 [Manis pentadactyla]|nr:hypothetical protein MUG91_G123n19 [Manis pentadactyla]